MLWDDRFLYVLAEMEEPHVWGTIAERNAVIFHDNDFEVFLDPDGDGDNYHEFEMNALNTIWELTLPVRYSRGGSPINGTNLPGLVSAVHVDGTLNDPRDADRGWSVEIAFPFAPPGPLRRPQPAPARRHLAGQLQPRRVDAHRGRRQVRQDPARAESRGQLGLEPAGVDRHAPAGTLGIRDVCQVTAGLAPHTVRSPTRSILASIAMITGCHRETATVTSPDPAYIATAATVPAIATQSLSLHDARRDKDVPIYAVFPTAPGPWPAIVFSHGNQSSGPAMAGLFASWAAHGYVCLAPSHDDTVSLRTAAEAAGARNLPPVGMIEPRGAGTENILNRARDVSFVIDALAAVEATLHVHVDRAHIGVGGHSSGAYTALLVAGATANMDDVPRTAVDARPRAFLTMAGLGSGQGGLTVESWKGCARPLMNVTGSLDRVPRGLTPQQKREPFALSPPGDKFEVYLDGANHGTFTCDPTDVFYLKQLGGSAAQQAVLFDDVHDLTLAYWDAYLKGSAKAAGYLRSGDAARRTGGRATVECR